jgi:uncharacterized protein (TIGR02453 family)
MINFEGFSQATIDFMWNLRFNNNKPWFEEHKAEFIEVFQNPMKALGREVFGRVEADFGGRGFIHKVSRVYKDARRVKYGEPYRPNLWFSIERPVPDGVEWTSTPVFWFELSPDNWTYGLGYYSARAETMAKLRARIYKKPKAFEKLIAPLGNQSEFALEGAEYVRKKEAPTEKTAAWYNKKSFSLIHEGRHGKELFTADLADRIVKGYAFLMPFYDYFITLDSDPSPIKEGL